MRKVKISYILVFIFFILGGEGLRAENRATLELNIFFTNDVHGGIVPQSAEFLNPEFPPILGGGASAMTVVNKARQNIEEKGDASILIDAGDIFQGTLVGTLSRGFSMIEYMNMASYDVCVPGNHDFDLGKENLQQLIEKSDFPWVSCNIVEKETGKLWAPLHRYVIRDIQGISIGFTGTTTVGTEQMSFPENIRGLDFIPEITALQETVNELREKEKVDLVIVLVHTGLPYDWREGYRELQKSSKEQVLDQGYANAMEIAHFVKGIDVLLGGHLHRGYQKPWVDPVNHTICIQNYGNGGNLGWVTVNLDRSTRTTLGYSYPADQGSLLLLQEDEFWPDSVVAAYVHSQQELYEEGFRELIGTTQSALTRTGAGESPMYNLVTDALRDRVNADFAFTNFGGVRADIKAGPITREDIFRVLPFGNQIVEFQATGKFLKRVIEERIRGNRRGLAISRATIVYNPDREDGDKITQFLIDGHSLQADRLYRVATTDYLMEGNSGLGLLRDVPREHVAYTGILFRDAVIEFIGKNSPLQIKIEGRWKKKEGAEPDPEWNKQFHRPQVSLP